MTVLVPASDCTRPSYFLSWCIQLFWVAFLAAVHAVLCGCSKSCSRNWTSLGKARRRALPKTATRRKRAKRKARRGRRHRKRGREARWFRRRRRSTSLPLTLQTCRAGTSSTSRSLLQSRFGILGLFGAAWTAQGCRASAMPCPCAGMHAVCTRCCTDLSGPSVWACRHDGSCLVPVAALLVQSSLFACSAT